jgi:hypothetical protein
VGSGTAGSCRGPWPRRRRPPGQDGAAGGHSHPGARGPSPPTGGLPTAIGRPPPFLSQLSYPPPRHDATTRSTFPSASRTRPTRTRTTEPGPSPSRWPTPSAGHETIALTRILAAVDTCPRRVPPSSSAPPARAARCRPRLCSRPFTLPSAASSHGPRIAPALLLAGLDPS